MTNFRIWKPTTDRWVLINEQTGALYDAHRQGKTLNVQSASGLAKGEYETIEQAVTKFDAVSSNIHSPVGVTLKVSV